MEAESSDNTVGGLDGKFISFPVVYANAKSTGDCKATVTYTINYDTDIPEAQQALEDFVAAQNLISTSTEKFDYSPSCIASGDQINTISGTGTMVELAAQILALETAGQIEVVSIANVTDLTMANIKAALIALMEAESSDNTVGGLDGKFISFPVVYANAKSTGDCKATVTYTINYDTDIPEAQQALEDYAATVETELEEDFAGLCLEGDDLIAEISGTGKMVELFAQIAALEAGGQISVVSVAGITYTNDQANMAAIGLAIKALMMADGRETVSDLDEVTITIPVVFANALNTGCTSLVEFEFTFDTSIPDNPLAIVCPGDAGTPGLITVNNTLGQCEASVTFAATVTGVPEYTLLTYRIGIDEISSPHIFPVGTTTVTVTATNVCDKVVTCTFDVVVMDAELPEITCPVLSDQNVNMNQVNGCTYVHSGTGWNATATDNCTSVNNVTLTAMLTGATTSGPHTSLDGVTFESGTTTVTWKATDAAGKIAECSFTVNVTGVTLSGTIKYHNNANTPMQNVDIKLVSGATEVTTLPTASNGAYSFENVCPGTYDVVITVNKSTAGALNVTDAAQVNSWFVNQNNGIHTPAIEKVRFLAGDVSGIRDGNLSYGDFYLESDDAGTIQRYFVTGGTQFQLAPLWEFWHASVIINTQQDDPLINNVLQVTIPTGVGTAEQNFLAMVSGDFNRSFTPSAANLSVGNSLSKSAILTGSKTLMLNQGENIEVLPSTTVDLPLKAETAMQVGAISLILNYPVEKLEVENVFLRNNPEQPVMFAIVDDELRIGWNSMESISLAAGETMLTVRLKTTSIVANDEVCQFKLSADPLNELADGGFEVIQNASLKVDGLKLAKNVTTGIEMPVRSSQMLLTAYPNPFREYAKIKYTLPEDGTVNIEVTGILGNRVRVLTNQQQIAGEYLMNLEGDNIVPGVYQITLRFKNQYGKELTQTIRMVKQ
jgi:hypothetical protein